MSSHPKDATEKLFRAMAECEKCAHQMHLPVQSGNDRVLHAMNRGYTREKYLAQVALARQYMPDLVLTTDIIVGFPGETDAEFDDTLSLIETVRYDAMFTFIYSPRVGTPAAKMPDPYTRAQKQVRFDALVAAANRISEEKHRAYEGQRAARARRRGRWPGRPSAHGAHEGRPPRAYARGRIPCRPVRGREDHRKQHLGALWRGGMTHGGTYADEAAIL